MEAGPATRQDDRPPVTEKNCAHELEQLSAPSNFAYRTASQLVATLESNSAPMVKWTRAGIALGLGALASITSRDNVQERIVNASRVDESLSSLHLMAREKAPRALIRASIKLHANVEAEGTPLNGPLAGRTGVRPLHYAAIYHNATAAEAFFDAKADPNARDSAGETPIRAAYGDGSKSVPHGLVQAFKRAGADLNIPGLDGSNALSACICAGRISEALYLVSEGANLSKISAEEWTRVANALAGRFYYAIQESRWPHAAAYVEEIAALEPVLGRDATAQIVNSKPASTSFSALHAIGAFGGPVDLAEKILQLGGNIEDTADVQIGSKRATEVRSLSRPLHLAVLAENYELMHLYLSWNADPRARDSRGENPLFMLYRNDSVAAKRLFVESLVRKGVEVNDLNVDGVNCPSLCLKSARWSEATVLGEFGGKPFGLEEEDLKKIQLSLRLRLGRHAQLKEWDHFEYLLNYSEWQFEEGSPGFVRRIINSRSGSEVSGVSLFHELCSSNVPPPIFNRVLDLGADLHSLTTFQLPDDPPADWIRDPHSRLMRMVHNNFGELDRAPQRNVDRVSPLHLLVASGNRENARSAVDRGASVNAADSAGNTPFIYGFLTDGGIDRTDILRDLLSRNANPYQQNNAKEDAYIVAFKRGQYALIAGVADLLTAPPRTKSPFTRWYRTESPSDLGHFESALTEVVAAGVRNPAVRQGVGEILLTSQNLDHALQFINAFDAATQHPFSDHGEQLAKLMPHLLSTYRPQVVANLARIIQSQSSSHGLRGYHPNETELMAMLNHPRDLTRTGPMMDTLTSSITSIGALYTVDAKVSGVTAANWGRIGTTSLSFSRLKFDAARVFETTANGDRRILQPSLLEQWGMRPMPELANDAVFGTGFLLAPGEKQFTYYVTRPDGEREAREFDQRTTVIFRRGHYLVSHPEHGTLLIRNSSPEFGRNTLNHPGYWSLGAVGEGFKIEDLYDAGDRIRGHFEPLLEATYNHDKFPRLQGDLQFLVEQLRAVFEDYAAWKFDTRAETAWEHIEDIGPMLQGGHLSRGFKAVVKYLEETLEQSVRNPGQVLVPDLAFMHPDFTPWNRFTFEIGNQRMATLKVTPEVVEVMRQMAEGDYEEKSVQSTGIRQFFQQAGFSTQGELIFVRPA